MSSAPHDVHSYARPTEAVVRHLDLHLKADFSRKELSGFARLTIANLSGTDTLHLDARDLVIESVTIGENNLPTTYHLGESKPFIGSDLAIAIPPDARIVTVHYHTLPQAAALQWLEPAQTAGGKYPFLFTQSQAILARTWVPCQDSPGIRFSYTADIECPIELLALMSAENDTIIHKNGRYHFEQKKAIPSYLLALSIGDLRFKPLGSNCGVYAEPVMLEKSANEFSDLFEMIKSAESLYGAYVWGRYDVLVLPPSFPFGGMENPCITFATPTIIAGDKSLVSLVAHELAHSWSGNLVTNATWNDFWLNEGFTVYFEARIMEQLYGKSYADMLTKLSLTGLRETIETMGDTSADTKLKLNLDGRDPDEGVSDIAYEKGRFFLLTIEKAVGRPVWDAFVIKYFHTYSFRSMGTEQFLEFLQQELIHHDPELEQKIRINDWVYGTGLPSNCPEVVSDELDKAENAAQQFLSGTPAYGIHVANWSTHHWLCFLRALRNELSYLQMGELDEVFNFSHSGNAEILCDWFLLAIQTGYEPAYDEMEKYLCSVGRRKFLRPLYSKMAETPEGLKLALSIYAKARPGYHAVSRETIDKMLHYAS